MTEFDLFGEDNLVWSGDSVFEPHGPLLPTSPSLEMMGQSAGATIYGHCHQRDNFYRPRLSSVHLRLEPEDVNVLDCLLTLTHAGSEDIAYSIAQFLDMMARTIIVEDRFAYELRVGQDRKTGEIVKLNFCPVSAPGDRQFVCGRHVVQVLPPSVAQSHACSRIRRLHPSDTFIFQAPLAWKYALRRARSALRFFDATEYRLMDELAELMTRDRPMARGYDHSSNLKMLARETAPIGWSGGGIFRGYQTDYLALERQIRWSKFCIDLRNQMISDLQRAVRRIADVLNCECCLKVEETSEYSLEDIRRKLREGKTSTVELVGLLF